MVFPKFITKFALYSILTSMGNDLNRIKVVLVEKKRTNKWLAEQLGKDPATVSKWCTNTAQPGLETLRDIANLLEVDIRYLINSTLTVSEPDVMYVTIKK
jgi:hypothetical protein